MTSFLLSLSLTATSRIITDEELRFLEGTEAHPCLWCRGYTNQHRGWIRCPRVDYEALPVDKQETYWFCDECLDKLHPGVIWDGNKPRQINIRAT